jgi:hypothetical protein
MGIKNNSVYETSKYNNLLEISNRNERSMELL